MLDNCQIQKAESEHPNACAGWHAATELDSAALILQEEPPRHGLGKDSNHPVTFSSLVLPLTVPSEQCKRDNFQSTICWKRQKALPCNYKEKGESEKTED